jgi:hypothetical protein
MPVKTDVFGYIYKHLLLKKITPRTNLFAITEEREDSECNEKKGDGIFMALLKTRNFTRSTRVLQQKKTSCRKKCQKFQVHSILTIFSMISFRLAFFLYWYVS